MEFNEREAVKNLIQNKKQRLYLLQLQQARKGINTDPDILIEIDDITKEIRKLETQLAELAVPDPAPTQPAPTSPPIEPPPAPPANPLQVTLEFEPTADRSGARIAWKSWIGGETTSQFTIPYPLAELPLVIKALDAAQHPDHPTGGPQFSAQEQAILDRHGLWKNGRVLADAHRAVGKRIYAALIDDRKGEIALSTARNSALNERSPISYVLRFPEDAVELASLPWEGMRDTRSALLLARGAREIDSCQRYLNMDVGISKPLPAGKKLHILALSPQAGIPESVRGEERDTRLKSWDALKAKGLIDYDELTHEDSLRQLPFRGNCLNWVLGHIAVHRDKVLETLGEPPVMGADGARYTRESDALTADEPGVLPLEELLDRLDRAQERIAAALGRMDDAALSRELTFGDRTMTVAQRAFFLYFHESYHVGQTELLRQLAGKDDKVI